jgi:ATP-dependent DNA ligase
VDSRDQARRLPDDCAQAGRPGTPVHAQRLRLDRALSAYPQGGGGYPGDGEAVCCDEAGIAVFEKLHSRANDDRVFLYAFDLLELDGEDWRARPLEARKAKLQTLLAKAPAGIQYSEHLEGDGAAIFAHACRLGAEGIVSKHREHSYRSGPSKTWLKIKNPSAPGVLRFEDRT